MSCYYEVYQLEPKLVHMPYYAPGVRNEHQATDYMSSLCEIGWALNKRVVFGVVKVTELFDVDHPVQHREIASTGWYGPAPPDSLHPAVLQELREAFLVDSYKTDESDAVSDELLEGILGCIPEYSPAQIVSIIEELKENFEADRRAFEQAWYARAEIDALADALGKGVIF
jgi:hypothetical protein